MSEFRWWRASKDGEELITIVGPDAEQIVRAAAEAHGGTVAYRDSHKPTQENGWTAWGPWIDVDPDASADPPTRHPVTGEGT